LAIGRVSKIGRILHNVSENGRPEIFVENRRYPARMGGLESLGHCH